MIPLSAPSLSDEEIQAVVRTLRSGRLCLGPELEAFERDFAAYTGAAEAVAVSSGTAGLHCVLRALGIGPGDEVITSPFSFIASANSVLFEKAMPVFVDIDERSYNIDTRRIEERITPKTKAILAVHLLGVPCDMDALNDIARRYGLLLIEDACEALGGTWRGQKLGSLGTAGVFGFYPNKQMTTGEGGMIVTPYPEVAALCRSLRNQGRHGHNGFAFERLGYNYRMSDIQASLGRVQLRRLDSFLEERRRVAERYLKNLRSCREIVLPPHDIEGQSWFIFLIRLADRFTAEDRAHLMELLRKDGIQTAPYFPPIHLQAFYSEQFGYREGDFPVTEKVAKRTLALPFFSQLDNAQIDYVCDRLLKNLSLVPV